MTKVLKKLLPLSPRIRSILPLRQEIDTYYKIVEFGSHNYDLLLNDLSMKHLYYELEEKKNWTNNFFEGKGELGDYLHFIWKSHPVDYSKKTFLSEEKFLGSVKAQAAFCIKFKDLLYKEKGLLNDTLIHECIEDYIRFLHFSNKERIIVPRLKEDFVWHAHMNNAIKYQADMDLIFGYILDHDDSISDEKLKELRERRKQLEPKAEKNETVGGGCGSSCSSWPEYKKKSPDPVEVTQDIQSSSGDSGDSGDSGSSCSSGCGGGD